MADPVTAALLKEAGSRAPTQQPSIMQETPAQTQEFMSRRLDKLKLERDNPELGNAGPALEREIAATESRLGQSPQAPQPAPAPQAAAQDPVTAALRAEAKAVSNNAIPGNPPPSDQPQQARPSVWDRAKTALSAGGAGPLEAGLTLASGAVGGVVGSAAGIVRGLTGGKYGTAEGAMEAKARAAEIAAALTYEPRLQAGKAIVEGLGDVAKAGDLRLLQGVGPAEAVSLSGVLAGPKAAATVRPQSQGASAGAAPGGRMGSVGAAGVDLTTQAEAIAANASPEIKMAVKQAGPKITKGQIETLKRYVDADTLPVKMNLMTGQATDNPTLMSKQFNSKGSKPKVAEFLKEQNNGLIENTNAIREAAAPDIFVTSKPAIGGRAIEGYENLIKSKNAEIAAKYKALEDANGGTFPFDAKSFVAEADNALHKKLRYDYLPSELRQTIDRAAKNGTLTFEQFESLRTDTASILRSNATGPAKQATAIVRNALEKMPIPEGAGNLKALADDARAAVVSYNKMLESDPTMKAVSRGKASADKFIDKYLVSADTKHVEAMQRNLAADPVAQQAVAAGAIQKLKEAARIVDDKGVFNQAAYNKTLDGLRPKLQAILPPEQMEHLEQLGRVARYVKGQDAGTFFNNSNSWIAALGDMAKSTAEGAANVAAHGVPVGTWIRKVGGHIKEQRDLNRSMQTGAGITLKEAAEGSRK